MGIEYIDYTTGNTLYAKPKPTSVSPWSGDAVSFFENGSTGEYSGFLPISFIYTVFEQSGGSPGSGDLKIGSIDLTTQQISLADGSISSGTFDNLTAFPIVSIDDGDTRLFRASDTISGVNVNVDVDYVVQIPAVNLPQVTPRNIQIHRSTEWNIQVSGIGANASEFFFTIKDNKAAETDAQSALQINTSGVTYLNEVYVGVPSGQLTYSSGNGGTLSIFIEPEITSLLIPDRYEWDLKGIDGVDRTTIRSYGNIDIKEVVTRRIG